jgi:hypothetical protein
MSGILEHVAESPSIRASDSDRERVADLLRRHCGEGRLTLDELGERLAEVYAARTLEALHDPHGPLRELPALAPPPPAQITAIRGRVLRTAGPRRSLPEHVAVYVAVNAVLVIVWAVGGAGFFWPIWAIVGWGVVVATHYARAQRPPPRPR